MKEFIASFHLGRGLKPFSIDARGETGGKSNSMSRGKNSAQGKIECGRGPVS